MRGFPAPFLFLFLAESKGSNIFLFIQQPPKCLAKSRLTNSNPSAHGGLLLELGDSNLKFRSKNDLSKQLVELKNELLALRVQKIAGGSASKLTKMCAVTSQRSFRLTNMSPCSNTVRKSIARVLTVMNHKARQNLREYYKDKKYLPLDLRAKKTRAIRRRLTKASIFRCLLHGPYRLTRNVVARDITQNVEAAQEGCSLSHQEVRSQGMSSRRRQEQVGVHATVVSYFIYCMPYTFIHSTCIAMPCCLSLR